MEHLTGIEKLHDPSDWSAWKFRVRIALSARGLFDFVTGDIECPSEEEEEEMSWRQKDFRAQQVITVTIAKKNICHLYNCKTAKEMWDKLHVVFEKQSLDTVVMLYERLFGCRKKYSMSVAALVAEVEEIAEQLKNAGQMLTNELLITKILRDLPAEYDHFRKEWEASEASEKTIDNLRAKLMVEENRLETENETKDSNEKKNQKNAGKQRKNSCFICEETDHLMRDCPQKKC